MKVSRYISALPLMAVGLWAASPAVNDLILPERILPQLDVILKGAVQQSPRMVSRALDLEIAENNRIQARSNLLPSLSAGYSYLKSKDKTEYLYDSNSPGINSVNAYTLTKTPYNVSFNQPLYYWGERRNSDRIGAIQLKMAQGLYREGYRLLVQELRGSYMRLIAQKLIDRRAHFYLEYTNNLLKQQEERLVKKLISEVEISTARLAAEQAQIALERAAFDLLNAKASFARLAGIDVPADEAIPDTIPVITYAAGAYDQLLAAFLAQKDPPTNEAFSMRSQLAIENLTYASAKTRLWPKFNFVAGLSQDEQNNLYGTGLKYLVVSRFAGVSMNWTIFDGFSAGAATRNSLARRRQLENDYRQLTERLAQDAQIEVKQINFSARSMSIYDRFQVSGEGYLKTVQDDFGRGLKSEADVSLARISMYDAQVNAVNARSDFLLKTGDFLGTVMEDPIVANLPEK